MENYLSSMGDCIIVLSMQVFWCRPETLNHKVQNFDNPINGAFYVSFSSTPLLPFETLLIDEDGGSYE